MKLFLSTIALVMLASTSDAFSVQRRNVFGVLGSAAGLLVADAAGATSAKTGQAAPFTGVS